MVGNFARQPTGGDIDQIRAVAAGACQVALTNSYYYLRLAASKDAGDREVAAKVGWPSPSRRGWAPTSTSPAAGWRPMRRTGPTAIAFLRFLASDEAQRVFSEGNNEFPAVPAAPMPPHVAAYARFKADQIALAKLGEHQAQAQAVFNEAGWR